MLAQAVAPRRYKYYDFVMAAFVTVYLCANLIGPAKPATVMGFTFGAGVLFFPASYLFGDILTEVYGYKRARRVIWSGFGALMFASIMATVVVKLPPAANWPHQAAYENIFGQTPRIVIASLIAFFAGEFVNSFVLAKMKILTSGKHLWTRTIGSTIAGEAVDTLIFYPVAFYATWDNALLLSVMVGNYIMKVLWEVVVTPITYKVVAWLKRAENEDYYDRDTNFTPFSLET
jgi:queuosine precursor transporter